MEWYHSAHDTYKTEYMHHCSAQDGRRYQIGRKGAKTFGRPFLRVFAEPLETDCFLNPLTSKSKINYLMILTEDEYFAYHHRMLKQAFGNASKFDSTRLLNIKPDLGNLSYTFIYRTQEPFEEELFLAMAIVHVLSQETYYV